MNRKLSCREKGVCDDLPMEAQTLLQKEYNGRYVFNKAFGIVYEQTEGTFDEDRGDKSVERIMEREDDQVEGRLSHTRGQDKGRSSQGRGQDATGLLVVL